MLVTRTAYMAGLPIVTALGPTVSTRNVGPLLVIEIESFSVFICGMDWLPVCGPSIETDDFN